MDFSFSEEQQLLCETARSYARQRFGSATMRARLAGEWKERDEIWREMAGMGWLGILVPEASGGTGGSLVDACILTEELTRALAPVPFEGNALVAASALRGLASPARARESLSELAAGRSFSVLLGEDLTWPPAGPGSARAWQWSPGAVLLVAGSEGLTPLDSTVVSPAPQQDLLHESGVVEGAPVGAGPELASSEAGIRFLATAQVATGAALVGAMAGALDLCVAHVSQREQFGRKIGSFQAVRHLCADMLVDLESSRSALYGAAWAVEHLDARAASRQAAVAKAWCSEAGVRVCERAVQVHGGIGCTWASDVHLYLRVAHVEGAAFGGAELALDRVAALSLDSLERGDRGSQ